MRDFFLFVLLLMDNALLYTVQYSIVSWFEEKLSRTFFFDPQTSVFLSFETKTLKKCSSYVSFVLAFKTIDEQMLFWLVFLKTISKSAKIWDLDF